MGKLVSVNCINFLKTETPQTNKQCQQRQHKKPKQPKPLGNTNPKTKYAQSGPWLHVHCSHTLHILLLLTSFYAQH